jgi:transposase-like protein
LYDRKFKLEAVRMVLEKGNGVRETARLLGISRATLAGWMRELKIQH